MTNRRSFLGGILGAVAALFAGKKVLANQPNETPIAQAPPHIPLIAHDFPPVENATWTCDVDRQEWVKSDLERTVYPALRPFVTMPGPIKDLQNVAGRLFVTCEVRGKLDLYEVFEDGAFTLRDSGLSFTRWEFAADGQWVRCRPTNAELYRQYREGIISDPQFDWYNAPTVQEAEYWYRPRSKQMLRPTPGFTKA